MLLHHGLVLKEGGQLVLRRSGHHCGSGRTGQLRWRNPEARLQRRGTRSMPLSLSPDKAWQWLIVAWWMLEGRLVGRWLGHHLWWCWCNGMIIGMWRPNCGFSSRSVGRATNSGPVSSGTPSRGLARVELGTWRRRQPREELENVWTEFAFFHVDAPPPAITLSFLHPPNITLSFLHPASIMLCLLGTPSVSLHLLCPPYVTPRLMSSILT